MTNILDPASLSLFVIRKCSPKSLPRRTFGANLPNFTVEHGVCLFVLITRPKAHGD